MAYANLINQTCTSKAEFFKRIRDFICKRNGSYDYSTTGIGWTLYDSFYAVNENSPQTGDWFVIYSPGESGRENIYCLIKWYSTDTMDVTPYLYWNTTTNTGVIAYGGIGGYWPIAGNATSLNLWIYGDLNQIAFSDFTNVSTFVNVVGKLQSLYETETIGYSTASVTSGSNKVITVDIDLPSDWTVGNKVFIWDIANIELTTITAINSINKTITVTLANSYTGTFRVSRFCGYGNLNVNGVASLSCLRTKNNTTSNIGATDPGFIYSETTTTPILYPVYDIIYTFTGGIVGKLRNILKTSVSSPIVTKDVMVMPDSTNYRVIAVQTSYRILFKEV